MAADTHTPHFAALRDLSREATPGPLVLATSNSWRRIVTEHGRPVCEPIKQPDGHPDLHFRNGGPDGPDARLLIAAYNAAPALLAEVEALRAALTKLLGATSKATAKRAALATAREKRRGDCMREEIAYAKACADEIEATDAARAVLGGAGKAPAR